MCYTTNEYAKPRTEVKYNATFPYGTDGYRTNCNNIKVSWLIHGFEWLYWVTDEQTGKGSGNSSDNYCNHLTSRNKQFQKS